jgi:hypothetical protein
VRGRDRGVVFPKRGDGYRIPENWCPAKGEIATTPRHEKDDPFRIVFFVGEVSAAQEK